MNKKKIIFITGTPGVGKTTVSDYLNKELNKKYYSKIYHINEIAIENDLIQGKDSERGYQIVDIDKLNKKLFEIIHNDNFENLNHNIKNKNNIENDKEIKNKNNIENDKEIKNKNNKNNIENDKKIKNKNNKKYIESDRDIKNKNSEKNKDLFDCDNNNDSIISDDLKIAIVEGHLSHLCEHCDKVIVLRLNPKILEKRLEKRDYLKSKIQENLEAESLAVCSVEAFQKHGDIVNEIDTTDMSIEEVATNIEKIISSEKDYPVGKIDFMDWLIRG